VRILVTGSRTWSDREALEIALRVRLMTAEAMGEQLVVVHGDCPQGADALARDWATRTPGVAEEAHPARWYTEGRAAGLIRNSRMVAAGADECLAFIQDDSRGATHCAQRADEAGMVVSRYIRRGL